MTARVIRRVPTGGGQPPTTRATIAIRPTVCSTTVASARSPAAGNPEHTVLSGRWSVTSRTVASLPNSSVSGYRVTVTTGGERAPALIPRPSKAQQRYEAAVRPPPIALSDRDERARSFNQSGGCRLGNTS